MSVNKVNSDGSLSKIAGRVASGTLVPSVSLYQSGKKISDTTSWSSGETGTFSISLSEDMNDTDYVVVPTLSVTGVSANVHSKTSNSFKITVRNDRTETIASAITLYWQAFRLMTNEQHALDETAIAQNTSDISDLQAVVPSGASASNQLLVENTEYPKTLLQGYQDTAGVLKVAFSQATQCDFLVNIGYGGAILVSVHTRNDRVTAIQLGSQSGSTPTNATIKVSGDGLTLFFAWNADAPISIVQLYKSYYNTPTVTVTRVSTSDTSYTEATTVNVRRAITSSDLTSTVTSGSNAPITSGGVASETTRLQEEVDYANMEVKTARYEIGDITSLETTDQADLVSAINELVHRINAL